MENDPTNPSHYTDLVIEPWLIAMMNKMPALDHLALRYLMRWRKKDGVKDLRKLRRVVDMLIFAEENGTLLREVEAQLKQYSRCNNARSEPLA